MDEYQVFRRDVTNNPFFRQIFKWLDGDDSSGTMHSTNGLIKSRWRFIALRCANHTILLTKWKDLPHAEREAQIQICIAAKHAQHQVYYINSTALARVSALNDFRHRGIFAYKRNKTLILRTEVGTEYAIRGDAPYKIAP